MTEPPVVAYKVHGPPKFSFGRVPWASELILGEARKVSAGPPVHKHPHNTFGGIVGRWDTSGTSKEPFDIHNCKSCGSTKAVRLKQFQQLEVDPNVFNWLPSQGIFGF